MFKKPALTVYTIGHSTRTVDELIELLKAFQVTLVIDVRTVPHSRHNPQFNKETLPYTLKRNEIKYTHIPGIGGLRRPIKDSANLALKNTGFQGYADFMQTKDFTENLLSVIGLARENTVALMCSEAMPSRCHRNLIADALVIRHIKVEHILGVDSCISHHLNELAQVEGTKITYPLYSKETPQRMLSDFASK
ncbi:MAG: DUF488 domain-containing protein [Candidatus Bathyarchaeota archaeon]|nr:DUF488 domain-containing protein [Candidatus Bathyarchaeota archaeon]